jgi:hypothetical protein
MPGAPAHRAVQGGALQAGWAEASALLPALAARASGAVPLQFYLLGLVNRSSSVLHSSRYKSRCVCSSRMVDLASTDARQYNALQQAACQMCKYYIAAAHPLLPILTHYQHKISTRSLMVPAAYNQPRRAAVQCFSMVGSHRSPCTPNACALLSVPLLYTLFPAGVPYTAVPGHCYGVCIWRGHV